MDRKAFFATIWMLALLVVPAVCVADPIITDIWPAKTPANTGATVDILGTGFGEMTDKIYFPSNDESYVYPTALISGGIRVRVPATWSGDVYLEASGLNNFSNTFHHEISFSYMGVYWASMPFLWYLNENAAPGCSYNEVRDALLYGYYAWTCASGAITSYAGSTTTARTANDGENVRYWEDSEWNGDTTLAYATTWWNTQTNTIIESDIAFNSQYHTWSCSGDPNSFDIGHVGTHEEGHTLGLLDMYGNDDSPKTMYGWAGLGHTSNRTITTDDTYGVEFMYPHSRSNFEEVTPTGWSGSIVPRNVGTSTHSSCALPTALGGNTTTYLNMAAINGGADCAAPSGNNDFLVDGNVAWGLSWSGVWNPGVELSWLNLPTYITGGRHTLTAELDVDEESLESSEYDNTFEDQFVWSPLVLASEVPVLRDPAPPRGSMTYVNCDGFEFSTGGTWWAVVGSMMETSADDYDLRLHDEVPLATSGFASYVASSTMSGSTVDFVLVNGNNGGGADVTRWVGQNRWSGGTGRAHIEMCRNVGTLSPPVTTGTYYLQTNKFVAMHEIYLNEAGSWEFLLDNIGGNADLGFCLYDRDGTHFARNDYAAQGNYYGAGADESLVFDVVDPGYYGLVVFKSARSDLAVSSAYTLEIRRTPPNLTYHFAEGWDYPVVARNDNGASDGNVHLSPVLDGNTFNSHFSVSGINDGPNAADSAPTRFYVDEDYITYINWFGTIDPGEAFRFYNLGPVTVRGGRHTVEWRIDEGEEILESDEDDNVYIRQYIWSPMPIVDEMPVERDAPPVRGSGAFYNNDGFAQTSASEFAWVTVACPLVASDDYDLAVYDDYSGPESGFSDYFLGSGQGPGQPDYIAGSYLTAGTTRYPAVNFHSGGVGRFVIDNANSFGHLGNSVPASWSGETLPPNRIVDVFEVDLTDGESYLLTLANNEGTANLDVFAHKPSDLSLARFNAEFVWMAGGAGSDEGGEFVPSEDGYYVFVVVKNGSVDVQRSAGYDFSITESGTSAADDGSILPVTFALNGNHPNPFNPLTEISFEIPTSRSPVRLDVYDMNGRRIRTLVAGLMPAGRHRLQWDGRNDEGHAQASGTYLYQLKAGSFAQTRKMILLR